MHESSLEHSRAQECSETGNQLCSTTKNIEIANGHRSTYTCNTCTGQHNRSTCLQVTSMQICTKKDLITMIHMLQTVPHSDMI
jgi:hypothetical protein